MSEGYKRVITPTSGGKYVGEVVELIGCIVEADSVSDCWARLDDAIEAFRLSYDARGMTLPEPLDYSWRQQVPQI